MARNTKPLRFDERWQRRRARRRWWRPLGSVVLVVAIFGASWWVTRVNERRGPWEDLPARVGECGSGGDWAACALDGDTLYLRSGGEAGRVRLIGFDAPELDGGCPAERALALRARADMAAWLSTAPAALDGGAAPPRDRYGRELRRARRMLPGGQIEWLDDHMIEAGLARGEGSARAGGWCGI